MATRPPEVAAISAIVDGLLLGIGELS
jgi:hypothetical protein